MRIRIIFSLSGMQFQTFLELSYNLEYSRNICNVTQQFPQIVDVVIHYKWQRNVLDA